MKKCDITYLAYAKNPDKLFDYPDTSKHNNIHYTPRFNQRPSNGTIKHFRANLERNERGKESQ